MKALVFLENPSTHTQYTVACPACSPCANKLSQFYHRFDRWKVMYLWWVIFAMSSQKPQYVNELCSPKRNDILKLAKIRWEKGWSIQEMIVSGNDQRIPCRSYGFFFLFGQSAVFSSNNQYEFDVVGGFVVRNTLILSIFQLNVIVLRSDFSI